jgi:hypothetical protein
LEKAVAEKPQSGCITGCKRLMKLAFLRRDQTVLAKRIQDVV